MDPFDKILLEIEARRTAAMSKPGTPTDPTLDLRPPPPTCSICDDMGYVTRDVPIDHPDFGKSFPCRCQAEKRRARREQNVRSLSALGAFADKTFDTFNPTSAAMTDAQQAALRIAFDCALNYAENPQGWLLFIGPYGSGKTHLAAAIANHRVSAYGDEALLITVPDLLDHLRIAFAPTADVTYDALFDRVRNAPLLVLDDVGAESPTPWAREKLYQIFNHRHSRNLPMVITTNTDMALVDERIRSRLTDQALTVSIRLDVPDQRSALKSAALEKDMTNLDRYQRMTFETFENRRGEALPEDDQQRFEQAINVARAFADHPSGWLVLMGRPGTGKTHLAAAIAHQRKAVGDPLVFVSCSELIDYLRAGFTPNAPISFDRRLQQIKDAPFAVIDNLEISDHTSGWVREKLYEILMYRFDYVLPTVITTYQELAVMEARLASRIENKTRCTIPLWRVPPYKGSQTRRAARPRKP